MKFRTIVGKNIRRYRLKSNLSQEALAYKAKLHPNYISLLERGGANVSIDNLEKIAKVLAVKVADLVDENIQSITQQG